MNKQHNYKLAAEWTGNTGKGTSSYRAYERSVTISINNKVDILGTSDTAFNSDKTKHNPEDLLLAAVSSCHLLWYLHVCSEAGVSVLEYVDHAEGIMTETADGGGRFTEITLHPEVVVSDPEMIEKAMALHKDANKFCYIANSCNFPIHHSPTITAKNG